MDKMTVKQRVRERDGMRCTKCGMTNAAHLEKYKLCLHVHRIQPGSEYTLAGCKTLCILCHASEPRSPAGKGPPRNGRMVALPLELYQRLAAFAAKNDRPLAREVRRALEAYLERLGY